MTDRSHTAMTGSTAPPAMRRIRPSVLPARNLFISVNTTILIFAFSINMIGAECEFTEKSRGSSGLSPPHWRGVDPSPHWECMASTITVARRTSLTSFNPSRRRQRVDVYGQLKQPTMSSRDCVPSLLSEVSLTPVQPRGTACPSQSAEHHPRQPSNDNSKHFYSVTLLTLLYENL